MIPMCWKCESRIVEASDVGQFLRAQDAETLKLIGCKESSKVTDYESAKLNCPLHEEPFEEVIGKSVQEAQTLLEEQGYGLRVSIKDGQHCMLTMDYVPQRVNVSIAGNKVVGIVRLG
jgi:hypothetical protein